MTSPTPAPQDLNVGQVETVLSHLPQDAVAAEEWLAPLVSRIASELKAADPAQKDAIFAIQKKLYDFETVLNANAQATANATNQFSWLSTPFKGVAVQGSGQLAQTVQNIKNIPEGLKNTMTKNQHILHLVAGILQVVFLLFGVLISFFPNVGGIGVVGGVTLVSLISGIKNIINPYLSQYEDVQIPDIPLQAAAPRAQLVTPTQS